MNINWQGEQVELLSVLYELVQDVTIPEEIRTILLQAKNDLEKGHFDRQVVEQLKDNLRIFALKGGLNDKVTAFLVEISRKSGSNKSAGAIFDTLFNP